ncbi:hypothetical protein BS78_07G213800 [Paspalum vaginatum]|nr:hypothetical protein BS78_07G213800 [Paspalum vaginatum]
MAESLLLPWVQGMVGKAADALVQRVTSMWGVESYRRKLEDQLVYVRSLLADAEEKAEVNNEAGRAVKAWMKKLKAAAYEADDVLDDFRYEALRREAAESAESTSRKVLYFSRDRIMFHHKASRDLKNVLDKIDELVEEMNSFGLLERMEAPQIVYQQTHSALDESVDIFGRDDDREVVVSLLLDHQQDQDRHVQVLPIIGMGGLGKTTVAKMVFNDSRVQKHFELKMWHCVSGNFEATTIVRSVIELATDTRCDLPDNIELLRGKLLKVIDRKRYLLVLDDVWNEDQQKWEDSLKPLLCSSVGGLGSMIVVTSRSRQVASIMGTLPPHELACLSEDDSWKLFSRRAFSKGVQMQAELVVFGTRIVKKCKGVPLALKTMGSLMSSMQQVQEWETMAASNVGDTVSGKYEILSILKLSYRDLSPEMKQCFAFCAIFPKDYEMEKDKLIQLWMANGLIHEERTGELLPHKAEFVFNELAWRSFFEDVKVRKFNTVCNHLVHSYEEVGCRMHDLMHDLAKDVTSECSSAAELNHGKTSIKDVQHMQVSGKDFEEVSGLLKGTSTLRTLLVQSKHNDLEKIKLMSLRALCCQDPSIIRCKLINTSHLRYLDLSGSDIVSLPNSICKLYNLLSLRLNGCTRLQYLPEGMRTLRNLEHIYLSGCEHLKRTPPKLSLLHNLRTLTKFIVDTEYGCGIEELEGLRHLGNRLELHNLRKVKCGSKANLYEKQNLTELLLNWDPPVGAAHFYKPTIDEASDEERVLEYLVPHTELKILEVHGYGGLKVSRWMKNPQMFRFLRELKMIGCLRCKDLPIVWLSSSLEYLFVSSMDSLTTLCKNIHVGAEADIASLQIFSKLQRMVLLSLPELERWVEYGIGEVNSSVTFPQLKELSIMNCPKLLSVPEIRVLTKLELGCDNASVPMYIPLGSLLSLRHLQLAGDKNNLVSIFNRHNLHLGLQDYLVSMEILEIRSCSNIVHWPMEELRCLPRLQGLRIFNCSKLQGKGSSFEDEEILPLPQLKWLYIEYCESLLQIPKLPASLEDISIHHNTGLLALPSNLGNLVKLRQLTVWNCRALKVLPNGMDGLTSLERLTICECPGIGNFPQDVLHQLPALKLVHIDVGETVVRRGDFLTS